MESSPAFVGMLGENPQDEIDGSPHDSWCGAGWGNPDEMMQAEVNSIHAQHVTAVTSQATSAAWHADIAAKQASNLAQWVQYLWNQVATLQARIVELEDWKKKTLDEMSKLRFEHKLLRRNVLPDQASSDAAGTAGDMTPPVPKAKSLPLLLSEHVEPSSIAAPPAVAPVPKRRTGKATTMSAGEDLGELAIKAGVPPPPGLEVHFDTPAAEATKADPADSIDDLALGLAGEGPPEGVHVERGSVDGAVCECAEWRIGHFSTKLKGCMGRALVSSPFSAWGIEDLRLMVFPEGKEVVKGPRSKRQKDQYARKVTEGPLEGCLKLKVPECPAPHILTYYLKVGNVRKGPFRHNFAESTVNGCSDFGVDWLQQVEADQGIVAKVEILSLETP